MMLLSMTPVQSETWILGGRAAAQVEDEIATLLQDAGILEPVTLLLDTGDVAFTLMQEGQV